MFSFALSLIKQLKAELANVKSFTSQVANGGGAYLRFPLVLSG